MDESKLWAFLATFLSIVGFVLALIVKRDDDYVMYYAKQSLMIFIIMVIANVALIVPLLGFVVWAILYLASVVLWLISWIYALSGTKKPVPLVGKTAENWFKNL